MIRIEIRQHIYPYLYLPWCVRLLDFLCTYVSIYELVLKMLLITGCLKWFKNLPPTLVLLFLSKDIHLSLFESGYLFSLSCYDVSFKAKKVSFIKQPKCFSCLYSDTISSLGFKKHSYKMMLCIVNRPQRMHIKYVYL